MYVVNLGLFEW